jgi:toxin YoeB
VKQKDRIAVFQPEFREDLRFWVETDRKIALRVFDLVEAIIRDPFAGSESPSRSSTSPQARGPVA